MYGMLAGTLFVDIFYDPSRWQAEQHRLLLSLGYFTRPLGAIGFGHLGDTWGRVKTLQAALLALGVASALIGALPPHNQAGWASWCGLIALHAVQGLGMGGMWGGFVLLCYEYCYNDRHKGLFSALPQAGRAVGYMLSSAMMTGLHVGLQKEPAKPGDEEVGAGAAPVAVVWDQSWWWRLAHALGLLLPAIAVYLHVKVPETPEFVLARREGRLYRFPLFKVRPSLCW